MKPSSVFLAENTNSEIETFLQTHHTVYIPVGATEQHGPHSVINLMADIEKTFDQLPKR